MLMAFAGSEVSCTRSTLLAAASSFLVVASFPAGPVLLPRDDWEEQAEGFQGTDQVQKVSFILAR